LHHTAQIVIVDLALHTRSAADFCRKLRQTPSGKECYALLLLPAGSESRTRELMAAGADEILLKPLNAQVLRVHLSTAARMRVLRAEIQRERVDIVRSTDEFAVAQKRLLQDALTDTLTQLPNRRYGLDFLASEWAFAQTSGAPIAFLMLDIDHFKRVNDTYGHAAGDVLLRQLADILKRTSRAEDMVFRYGGEEFGAILTNASLRTALQIGERIRLLVEKTPFQWEGQRLKATLSVGVALSSGREAESLVLIRAADAALYQAKARGRNRVVAAASTSSAAAAPPDE
jgi:diguanylate cyclase (GGDEF)-like protein